MKKNRYLARRDGWYKQRDGNWKDRKEMVEIKY